MSSATVKCAEGHTRQLRGKTADFFGEIKQYTVHSHVKKTLNERIIVTVYNNEMSS